jgi:drug/metabolite transporter (DMT)-like permease
MSTEATRPARSFPSPWLAFGTVTAIWGSTFLVIAVGNDRVPPVWGAALRLVLASALLLAILKLRRQPLPRGTALRAAMIFGFFQFGINFPLLYVGEKDVPSGVAAVIFATVPLSQALLTRAAGLERLDAAKLAGAVVALAGVALIFANQMRSDVHPFSLLWVLLATWAACVGTIALKRGGGQSPIASNAVATAVGAVVCFAWSFAAREPHRLPATVSEWWPILYLALIGSIGGFVIFAWLVHRWEVTRVSYVSVLIPVLALALGAAVRHERIGLISLAGSLVVLLGLAIALRSRPEGEIREPRRASGAG